MKDLFNSFFNGTSWISLNKKGREFLSTSVEIKTFVASFNDKNVKVQNPNAK